MSGTSRRRIFLTLLSALVLALSSMAAVFAGGQSDRSTDAGERRAAAPQVAAATQPGGGDHCDGSENKGHKDCKPENNPRPTNPPCDADHGHPAQNNPKRCSEGPPGSANCSDGVDNDGDGKTDQQDPDCQEPEGPPGDPTCSDGVDNDGDGKTDQEDPDCQEPEGPPGDPTCSDGVDNDGDGKTDMEDPDCQPGPEACPEGALIDHEIDGVVYACVILIPAEDESAVCPPGTVGPIATGENPLVEACVILGPTGDEAGSGTAAAVGQRAVAVALLTG